MARKRAHIRWMLKRVCTPDGLPVFSEVWTEDPRHRDPRLSEAQAQMLLILLDSPEWQSLAEGWLPPATEQAQIEGLELFLGTENYPPDPALFDPQGLPKIVCIWNTVDAPDPQPVYKLADLLTDEELMRVLDHLQTWGLEIRARKRVFSARLRERDEHAGNTG